MSLFDVVKGKEKVAVFVPLLAMDEELLMSKMREEEKQCVQSIVWFCDKYGFDNTIHYLRNSAEGVGLRDVKNVFNVVVCGPKNNEAVFKFFDRQELFRFYESHNEETEGQWVFAARGNKFFGTNEQVNYAFVGRVVIEEGGPECLLVCGMHGRQSAQAVRYICESDDFALDSGEWQLLRFDTTRCSEPEVFVEARGKII